MTRACVPAWPSSLGLSRTVQTSTNFVKDQVRLCLSVSQFFMSGAFTVVPIELSKNDHDLWNMKFYLNAHYSLVHSKQLHIWLSLKLIIKEHTNYHWGRYFNIQINSFFFSVTDASSLQKKSRKINDNSIIWYNDILTLWTCVILQQQHLYHVWTRTRPACVSQLSPMASVLSSPQSETDVPNLVEFVQVFIVCCKYL